MMLMKVKETFSLISFFSCMNHVTANSKPNHQTMCRLASTNPSSTRKIKCCLYICCFYMIYISCNYLKKILLRINVATDKGSSQNEIWHWRNSEIGVVLQSWLWVHVELMVWLPSRLEHLNGIQWPLFQILLRPTFYSYFTGSFDGEYHMHKYIYAFPNLSLSPSISPSENMHMGLYSENPATVVKRK